MPKLYSDPYDNTALSPAASKTSQRRQPLKGSIWRPLRPKALTIAEENTKKRSLLNIAYSVADRGELSRPEQRTAISELARSDEIVRTLGLTAGDESAVLKVISAIKKERRY
jgi:hypothetical protein